MVEKAVRRRWHRKWEKIEELREMESRLCAATAVDGEGRKFVVQQKKFEGRSSLGRQRFGKHVVSGRPDD